jgi:hypothetical protein
MMNEWTIALITSGVILAAIILGSLASAVIQAAWAWVNDSEAGENKVFGLFINMGKAYEMRGGYWTHKKEYEGKSICDTPGSWTGWTSTEQAAKNLGTKPRLTCLAPIAPIALLLVIKLWAVVAPVALLVGMAHLTRFTLRCRKALKAHANDKNAHKEESAKPEQE